MYNSLYKEKYRRGHIHIPVTKINYYAAVNESRISSNIRLFSFLAAKIHYTFWFWCAVSSCVCVLYLNCKY